MTLPYTPYSAFLQRHFAQHVQKLPVDAGATCPVRDGTLARGGCAFCNGRSYVPAYCDAGDDVATQLDKGRKFYARRSHHDTVYLAYLQNGSNTYRPVAEGEAIMQQALGVEGVKGVVWATRPDCLNEVWLQTLSRWARQCFVMVELGVETLNDDTLQRMGRGHCAADALQALQQLHAYGVHTCAHVIFGLPGDTTVHYLDQARVLSHHGVEVVKLHQLQMVRGARLAAEYEARPEQFALPDAPTYVQWVADYLENLAPWVAVERFTSQTPGNMLMAPRWGLKNDEVARLVVAEMQKRGTRQGARFTITP